MDKRTCMFTGHRFIPENDRERLWHGLKKEISCLYKEGVRDFITGGALGFDTLSALTVLALKEIRPNTKLHLFLPCHDQDKRWSAHDREIFRHILERADSVTYVFDTYVTGCMHARNRKMVDNADVCIAYLTRTSGGTAYTVDYAHSRGLKVIRL